MDEKRGYIYLIRAKDQDLYKIGQTSRDPEKRLKELNGQQSPYELQLVYYAAVNNPMLAESHFHKKFKKYHHHGEWFKLPPSMAASVIEGFKSYQPGHVHGAGICRSTKSNKPYRKYRKLSLKRRDARFLMSLFFLSIVLLLIIQKEKLLAFSKCLTSLDLNVCKHSLHKSR
jgi:predicted GIY-YIG superfamily endonuclease